MGFSLPHLGLHAKGFEREVQRLSKNVATNAARGLLFDFQAAMEQAAIANLYRQMREANWIAVVIGLGAAHARDRNGNSSRPTL
jgi:hypothetical protein